MSFSSRLRTKSILSGRFLFVNAYHVDMEEIIKQDHKPKVIEMAQKRRHIHLLEKLQRGKSATPTLSKSEIKELESLERDPSSPGIVDTQEKVAKIFGVATRTVERWVKDGMPVTPQGTYDLIEIRAWRTLRHQKTNPAGKKDDSTWEARYREYKARLEEIKLKKALGELIPKSQVESGLIQVSIAVKRAFLALPRQVAPQLVGLEPRHIEVLLIERIREIISLFADGKIFSQDKKTRKNAKAVDASA